MANNRGIAGTDPCGANTERCGIWMEMMKVWYEIQVAVFMQRHLILMNYELRVSLAQLLILMVLMTISNCRSILIHLPAVSI